MFVRPAMICDDAAEDDVDEDCEQGSGNSNFGTLRDGNDESTDDEGCNDMPANPWLTCEANESFSCVDVKVDEEASACAGRDDLERHREDAGDDALGCECAFGFCFACCEFTLCFNFGLGLCSSLSCCCCFSFSCFSCCIGAGRKMSHRRRIDAHNLRGAGVFWSSGGCESDCA